MRSSLVSTGRWLAYACLTRSVGDSCLAIELIYDVSLAQFIIWNPEVKYKLHTRLILLFMYYGDYRSTRTVQISKSA